MDLPRRRVFWAAPAGLMSGTGTRSRAWLPTPLTIRDFNPGDYPSFGLYQPDEGPSSRPLSPLARRVGTGAFRLERLLELEPCSRRPEA